MFIWKSDISFQMIFGSFESDLTKKFVKMMGEIIARMLTQFHGFLDFAIWQYFHIAIQNLLGHPYYDVLKVL